MNDIDRTLRHVGTLDKITEFAFVQTGLASIAQRRHAKITEMRPDTQPIKLFGRLHLSQSDVAAVEAFQLAEFCGQRRVLLSADKPNGCDTILPRPAPFERFDRRGDG